MADWQGASKADLDKLATRVGLLEKKTNLTRIPLDLDADLVQVTSAGSANAVFAVPHTLKRVPAGYFVARKQGGSGDVYEPVACPVWTATKIYLACSGTNVRLTLLLF